MRARIIRSAIIRSRLMTKHGRNGAAPAVYWCRFYQHPPFQWVDESHSAPLSDIVSLIGFEWMLTLLPSAMSTLGRFRAQLVIKGGKQPTQGWW